MLLALARGLSPVNAAQACGLNAATGRGTIELLTGAGYLDERGGVVHSERNADALKNPLRDTDPVPQRLRRAVLERDGWRCRACGSKDDLHVDHVYPRAYGGKAVLSNLQALCAPCNRTKADALPEGSS
jgi:hypothetical protein